MTPYELRLQGIDAGNASITITLEDGCISVYHHEGPLLLEVENAEDGSWDKIWETLHSLKSVTNHATQQTNQ